MTEPALRTHTPQPLPQFFQAAFCPEKQQSCDLTRAAAGFLVFNGRLLESLKTFASFSVCKQGQT